MGRTDKRLAVIYRSVGMLCHRDNRLITMAQWRTRDDRFLAGKGWAEPLFPFVQTPGVIWGRYFGKLKIAMDHLATTNHRISVRHTGGHNAAETIRRSKRPLYAVRVIHRAVIIIIDSRIVRRSPTRVARRIESSLAVSLFGL